MFYFGFYTAFFFFLSSVVLFLFIHHILEFSTAIFRRPSSLSVSELESSLKPVL